MSEFCFSIDIMHDSLYIYQQLIEHHTKAELQEHSDREVLTSKDKLVMKFPCSTPPAKP